MAPEVLNGEMLTYKSDVWSLGVTIFVLVCGNLPFINANMILNQDLEFPSKRTLSKGFKNLMTAMLTKLPA